MDLYLFIKIYADIWLYSLVSLSIIESKEKNQIKNETDDGEFILKRNFNKAIGVIKKYFIKALIFPNSEESTKAIKTIQDNINSNIIWIKKTEAIQEIRILKELLCHIKRPIENIFSLARKDIFSAPFFKMYKQ